MAEYVGDRKRVREGWVEAELDQVYDRRAHVPFAGWQRAQE